jgi:hypothetical protein
MGIRMERQDKVLVGNQMLVYRRSALEMGKERLEEENERKETTLSKMWEKISVMLEKEYIIMSRRVQLGDIIAALLMGATLSYMMLQVYLASLHMPPVVKIPGCI